MIDDDVAVEGAALGDLVGTAPEPLGEAAVDRVDASTPDLAAFESAALVRLERFRRLGWWLAQSEGTSTPQAGAAAALRYFYADALGFPPTAAGEIAVIDGRLRLGSKLLRAIAEQQGYRVRLDPASNDEQAIAVLFWGDREVGRSSFTMAEASRAGLASRTNWRNYPGRMLWARAAQRVLDDYAPGIVLGIDTGGPDDVEAVQFRDADLEFVGEVEDEHVAPETDEDIPF